MNISCVIILLINRQNAIVLRMQHYIVTSEGKSMNDLSSTLFFKQNLVTMLNFFEQLLNDGSCIAISSHDLKVMKLYQIMVLFHIVIF